MTASPLEKNNKLMILRQIRFGNRRLYLLYSNQEKRIMQNFLKIAFLILTGGVAMGSASGAAAKTAGFDEVLGKEWELMEVISGAAINTTGAGTITIDRQKLEADAYTLLIDNGRISGRASPNRYFAPYKLGNGREISFGPAAGTLMANITEPTGFNEGDYFRFLEQVYQWDLSKGKFELLTKNSGGEEAKLVYREKL
jgi:heat shock protein HslJ